MPRACCTHADDVRAVLVDPHAVVLPNHVRTGVPGCPRCSGRWRDHVFGNGQEADHVLVAGLVVIAMMIDRADDVDPALAHQTGGSVVLDHGAVGVCAAMQTRAFAVGGDMVSEQAGQYDAVGELAVGAEQDHLFVDAGRVPLTVRASAQGEPWRRWWIRVGADAAFSICSYVVYKSR